MRLQLANKAEYFGGGGVNYYSDQLSLGKVVEQSHRLVQNKLWHRLERPRKDRSRTGVHF